MTLNQLAADIHAENVAKGFDVTDKPFAQTCMLIVTEVAEAVEADRIGKYAAADDAQFMLETCERIPIEGLFELRIKDTLEDELTDALMRTLDLMSARGIDIDAHLALKRGYNKTRPHMHGGKRY